MWKKANIDVTLAHVEWNVFTDMRRKSNYQVARTVGSPTTTIRPRS